MGVRILKMDPYLADNEWLPDRRDLRLFGFAPNRHRIEVRSGSLALQIICNSGIVTLAKQAI
jgi:hypothetical protein